MQAGRVHGSTGHSTVLSRHAWHDWLAENGSRMLLFARQQTRTAEDAEDVFQDALVKLARKVDEGSFDGGQESWKPYLYTAIRRLAIDLGRKNDRRSKREVKSEGDRHGENGGMSDPWFESGSSNDETRVLLENSLKKLPSKFAEVIVMKIWGERTFAEIGEHLGVSLNTVASRYRYGLERLRKALEVSRRHDDI
ncbi:MAG: sigma-70 family RNA polymerase sigma factor [Verrucomicrobiae bacterium]|nr:sigma-70 family RNA polymerase sigma factor [Verrucomicrobiae bacterium]NNJ42352.1 sigma-70 family RNA polymerase sigma factor [Akkermansiaceae bacterium]